MDPLFPELPEDLTALSDEDLASLLTEHEVAADLIDSEDEQALAGMDADDVLVQYEAGVDQIDAIRAEQERRVQAQEEYLAKKAELASRRKPAADEAEEAEEDEDKDESEELAAEADEVEDEPAEADEEDEPMKEDKEEKVLVAASNTQTKEVKPLRRPPAPSSERQLKAQEKGAVLVATAGQMDIREGTVLDERKLAEAMHKLAKRQGGVHKSEHGVETKYVVAAATYDFPPERQLVHNNLDLNRERIRAVVPDHIQGIGGLRGDALVASGGLCAPLTPLYTLPNFASQARPVRDALPSFNASRGGVSVPTAHIIGDITSAISVITEAQDAEGPLSSAATKSCQPFDCEAWVDVTVTTIAHCRSYGNLNSRAWPEGIEHENALTMAAHARTAETYLLDRIKEQSLEVSRSSEVYNATSDLLYDILRMTASIRYNLRMNDSARFQALLPTWIQDMLVSDLANVQFDRFQARGAISQILARGGVTASYYMDSPSDAEAFSAEVDNSAIDDFPDDVEFALFPAGAFIHVDGGTLELGIVRDSTLNSTNDYQIFGESFENVARIAPLQATRWATSAVCPSGEFPALTTALSC